MKANKNEKSTSVGGGGGQKRIGTRARPMP